MRFDGKLALVTVATRGIGWAVAQALAAEGAHVLMLGRTQGALEELYDLITKAGGEATGVPLDLTDGDALDRLGAHIAERWGKLDMLVGNAGVLGPLTPVSHIDPDDLAKVLAVNVTANARLIRAMEPLLMQADAPRAVFTTSGAARKCRPFWGAYSTGSKFVPDDLRFLPGSRFLTFRYDGQSCLNVKDVHTFACSVIFSNAFEKKPSLYPLSKFERIKLEQ